MSFDEKVFEGKVVLITEASSGIGIATAIHFAQLGASLSLTGRNKQNLEDVVEQCGQSNTFIVTGDLSNEDDVKNIIESTIKHYDKLDILVNNVETIKRVWFGSIEATKICLRNYDNIFNANVRPVYQLIALAVPHLIKTEGNIINVSSLAGVRPDKFALAYSMSKVALEQFTRCITSELALKHVRVNTVNPHLVVVNLMKRHETTAEGIICAIENMYSLGIPDKVSGEIAKTIMFLARDHDSFVTGVTLPVNEDVHATVL